MSLKITFLGTGSAFTVGPGNYQSNLLLEIGNDTLLIDAGTDVRHSLYDQNRTYRDIKAVYISHGHGDHCGGLEWLALTSYFDPECKQRPVLFISDKMLPDLWNKTLSGGLSTLTDRKSTIDLFFDVKPVKSHEEFIWHSIKFQLVQVVHYYSEYELMPGHGLLFTYNKTRIFFTSDTQNCPSQLKAFYNEADIIFHDCETSARKSGVHAHYSDLVHLPAEIKKKMWLYHYNPGVLPDAAKDGFSGFVVKGQTFLF